MPGKHFGNDRWVYLLPSPHTGHSASLNPIKIFTGRIIPCVLKKFTNVKVRKYVIINLLQKEMYWLLSALLPNE